MKYAMHVEISQIFEVVDIINNNLVLPIFFLSQKYSHFITSETIKMEKNTHF